MRDFILSHSISSDNQICGQILLTVSNEPIGTYEFYAKEENFNAAINIFPYFQNKGIGYFVFKSCFEELNKNFNLKYFNSSWSYDEEYSHLPNRQSTNLKEFLKAVNEGMNENKALWKTPTGKWLEKIGFRKARVISRNSENIKAMFANET